MKKRHFNMVEVLLALGVTAIGIVGLMAVIPVSLTASRDAISETFVADIVNSKFDELSLLAAKDPTTFFAASTSKPAIADSAVWFPADSISGETRYGTAFSYTKMPEEGVVFTDDSTDGIYHVRVGKKGAVDPDFAADLCAWQTFPTDIADYSGSQTDLCRICLEVSWPVSTPYSQRQKRTFVREYINPKLALSETP